MRLPEGQWVIAKLLFTEEPSMVEIVETQTGQRLRGWLAISPKYGNVEFVPDDDRKRKGA